MVLDFTKRDGTHLSPIWSARVQRLRVLTTSFALRGIATLALSTASIATAAEATAPAMPMPMPERTWFAPTATSRAEPFCRVVERATRAGLSGSAGAKLTDGMPWQVIADTDGRGDDSLAIGPHATTDLEPSTGVPLLVRGVEVIGCGQACNAYGMQFARKGEPECGLDQKSRSTGPLYTGWQVVRDARGHLFALGSDVEAVYVYRIESSGVVTHVCDVSLRPDLERLPVALRPAKKALEALHDAASTVQGEEGDCGSMRSLSRWNGYLYTALMTTLYQPWALPGPPDPPTENSGGDYDRIEKQLELWSLGGEYEHRAHSAFVDAKRKATARLAAMYPSKFGWRAAVARQAADTAVRRALAQGFGFYMYDPYGSETQIRRAILDRRPIDEIRAIEFEPREAAREDYGGNNDGLAAMAVGYPEALRYLLERGVDPNRPNGFGKTPLMTAVHFNQLESARVLLDHGADVNASTGNGSQDRCFYSLNTSGGTTALHYAARYASADMIRLLVGRGADTRAVAERYGAGAAQPAADWLHVYTLSPGQERNPNVSRAEVPDLLKLMAPDRSQNGSAR